MNYHVVINYKGTREETVKTSTEEKTTYTAVGTVWQMILKAPNQTIAAQIGLANFQSSQRLANPIILSIEVNTDDEVLEVKAS